MARPMLDDLELQQVQTIVQDGDQVWTQHSIPALEGDFFQGLGRLASQVTLTGVLTGSEVADSLANLRVKFRAAEPVSFVADIATATRIDQVLIEEMGVRELAGKPARFEYAFTLREYIPATPTQIVIPPTPVIPPEITEESVLEVEVIVEGQPNFDHSQTVVRVEGRDEDGNNIDQTLTVRDGNVWTADPFPPGSYTAFATTTSPVLTGSQTVDLPLGQRRRAVIVLREGQQVAKAFVITYWFDKAFVEPCMRRVLQQVAEYAQTHPEEKLVIVGHTDESGSAEYNQSLSERRSRGAHAYLTFGRDSDAAVAEWDELRKTRTTGVTRTMRDTWSVRQYQSMLQDLGYYPGVIKDTHDAETDAAVRAFQADHGLSVDGVVGDQTWPVLIRQYMSQDSLAVSESQFMPNARDGCDHGVVRWLGCGEKMPLPSTPRSNTQPPPDPPVQCSDPGWRPNRRTELLFVQAEEFPCEVPKPATFDIPTPNSGGTGWCLGPDQGAAPAQPCCFITRDPAEEDKWLVQPAEPQTIVVQGRIQFEDGTPLADTEYVLIASDGEFMNGERTCSSQGTKGTPIFGRTDSDGNFTDKDGNIGYPNNPKNVGVFTLDIQAPVVARPEGEPGTEARGPVVCKRLDGSSDFIVIVSLAPASLNFVSAQDPDQVLQTVNWGQDFRIRADLPGVSGDEITVDLKSFLIRH